MDSDGPRRSSRISGKSIRTVKKQRRPTKRTVPRPALKGKSTFVKGRTGPKRYQRKVKVRSYGPRPTALASKSVLSMCPVTMAITPTGGQGKTTTEKGIARTKTRAGNLRGLVTGKSSTKKGRSRSKRFQKVPEPLHGYRTSTLSSRSIRTMCTTPTGPTWPVTVIKTQGEVPPQVPPQVQLAPPHAPPNLPALVAPGPGSLTSRSVELSSSTSAAGPQQASTFDPTHGDAQGPPHLPRAELQDRQAAPSNHQAAPFLPNRDNLDQQGQLAPVQAPVHLPTVQVQPEAPINPQAAAPEPDPDQDDQTEHGPEPESEPGSVSRRPWYQFR